MREDSEKSIEGCIEHIIYRNEENGYTVFNLTSEGDELTCVGFFQLLNEGENIRAYGSYTEHVSYGTQFKVDHYEISAPKDTQAMERYLGSGAIKGIGAALAARIVGRFKDDTLKILLDEPERLSEVRGISERKAQEIAVSVKAQEDMRTAMMFLQQYGITWATGVKIFKTYGQDMYTLMRENPYRLAEDIDGIGFRMADDIASKIGIRKDSEYRIKSGILYCLLQASGEGDVYLPQNLLLSRARELLGLPSESMTKAIGDLAVSRKIILRDLKRKNSAGDDEQERIVYASWYYYLELDTAHMLNALNVTVSDDEKNIENQIESLSKKSSIVLDDEQKQAVFGAATKGLLIITGGPGTGKTTTINEMIRYFESRKMDFLLAAPTGRAARRMTETTGYEASTIHRLLEISPSGRDAEETLTFSRNADNPLTADVIIIDEMSMVDLFLMHALLLAVPVGTRLVLVGDVDQLPSVGAGDVLRDMIRSDVFPTVTLTRIFRQAEGSDIVLNAHRINRGEQITLTNKSTDFFFLKRTDADRIIRNTIELIRDRLPKYLHVNSSDIQVLTPMRKGALGVERLNRILQQYLNPPSDGKKEKSFGNVLFRVGDKVMQTHNNYQLEWEIRGQYGIVTDHGVGIFNGDMGIVHEVNDFASEMEIEFDGGRYVFYPYSLLEELELSYAVTIHKSQGSEYPAVIIPILKGPKMLLSRNLLYTAVTRAKSVVVILGCEDTIRAMIANKQEKSRHTALDIRILETRS